MADLFQRTDGAVDSNIYYFDVFPVHRQPEHLESLTSYLMRLAESNGISSMDGLSALCFPRQDRRITRDIADYPPISFDRLPTLGNCTRVTLLATTFFHIAAKFGRSTLPQPLSRFLSGCVSQHLRYCPVCLAEQEHVYYLLPWRFLSLSCCVSHHCRLLEQCGNCGAAIPLFISPFKMGFCPLCIWNLRGTHVDLVSEVEHQEALARMKDIEFLLTPQQWELESDIVIRWVGQRLAYMRQKEQLTALEISSQLGVTLTVVEGIERGSVLGRGATFQSYVKYVDYLHLSLREVFSAVFNEFTDTPVAPSPRPECPMCKQNHSVIRDGYNRSGSQRFQCQHCFHSFTVKL